MIHSDPTTSTCTTGVANALEGADPEQSVMCHPADYWPGSPPLQPVWPLQLQAALRGGIVSPMRHPWFAMVPPHPGRAERHASGDDRSWGGPTGLANVRILGDRDLLRRLRGASRGMEWRLDLPRESSAGSNLR